MNLIYKTKLNTILVQISCSPISQLRPKYYRRIQTEKIQKDESVRCHDKMKVNQRNPFFIYFHENVFKILNMHHSSET